MFVETKSRGSKDTVQNATWICILLTQEPETILEYNRVDGSTFRNHHLLSQKAKFPLVYVDVCDITMSKPLALDVRQARGNYSTSARAYYALPPQRKASQPVKYTWSISVDFDENFLVVSEISRNICI